MCFKHNILFYNLNQNVFPAVMKTYFLQNTKDDFNICIRNDFFYFLATQL